MSTDAAPNTKVSTRRIIWKCPCGVKAMDYTATRHLRFVDKMGVAKWSDAVLTREVDGVRRDVSYDIACPTCKRQRKGAEVIGRVSEHKCDARCMGSTSGKCECSCGGKNHGASHL